MKKTLLIKIFLFSFIFSGSIVAQEEEKKEQEFKISAEIRPRLEYYHGYKQLAAPDQKHGLSISQRTRLNMDFKNPNFIVRLSLQDVRVWGDQNQSVGNELYSASIHEAWGEAIISPAFSIKLGRQEIAYDDQRLFGPVDWGQQGRSHDAAIFKLKKGKLKAELAIAYNQDTVKFKETNNRTNSKNYKALQNLWLNYKFSDKFNASFLLLNNGMQIATGGDAYSQTMGTRLTFDNKPFAAHAAFYYQTGVDASVTDINANYFWLDASYQISEKFDVTLGYEHFSGNSQLKSTDENKAFNTMYGTGHKFNGHMDYFYSGNHLNSVGLNDMFILLGLKLPKFSIGLQSHYFASAADIADPINVGEAADKFLGLEFDLFCDFNISKGVAVKAGYSHMFASESMEFLKGGDKDETNNWAFMMVTFKPTLFESKKEINPEK